MTIKYSQEFKRDAVAMVESGMTQKQVCRDLGISKSCLGEWVRDMRFQASGLEVPTDPEERHRVATLLRRVEELELENEILRKASAYLSQANLRRPK